MDTVVQSSKQHVFVLDDDEGILRLEQRALERAGYRVTTANSVLQATAAVARETPDLLILDYSLGTPESGLDFYRDLRRRGMTAPAILVTGYSDEGRAIEALRAGVHDVIPKIADYLDYLPEAVHRVLDQVRSTRALADAEASSRSKDHFIAVLSHELRTPLTPVLTAIQVLESARELSPDSLEMVQLIRRNVELEARLIDDLLDMTRVTSGKLELQSAPTDIHEKLRFAFQTVEDDARAKRLELTTHLQATRTMVIADAARLQQIFWNVLKNAVKFTPEGGAIVVRSTDLPDRKVRIDVTDTGIGVAPESLDRIFNPFEQGGKSVTQRFGGLGLGLNIARALVEAHGGRIYVTSGGLGLGSTFTVEIPIAPAPEEAERAANDGADRASAPPEAAKQSAATLRVLLVEDHLDTATIMAKVLRRSGYEVLLADSVVSALKIAAAHRFDLVVSDIGLPDGTGLDLMRQLRSRHPVRGIALSGFGTEQDVIRSKDAGFSEHLVKPINVDHLRRTLSRVLNNSTVPVSADPGKIH